MNTSKKWRKPLFRQTEIYDRKKESQHIRPPQRKSENSHTFNISESAYKSKRREPSGINAFPLFAKAGNPRTATLPAWKRPPGHCTESHLLAVSEPSLNGKRGNVGAAHKNARRGKRAKGEKGGRRAHIRRPMAGRERFGVCAAGRPKPLCRSGPRCRAFAGPSPGPAGRDSPGLRSARCCPQVGRGKAFPGAFPGPAWPAGPRWLRRPGSGELPAGTGLPHIRLASAGQQAG